MLVKTNRTTKNGDAIYKNVLTGKGGTLPKVTRRKTKMLPNGILGRFLSTMEEQRFRGEIRKALIERTQEGK